MNGKNEKNYAIRWEGPCDFYFFLSFFLWARSWDRVTLMLISSLPLTINNQLICCCNFFFFLLFNLFSCSGGLVDELLQQDEDGRRVSVQLGAAVARIRPSSGGRMEAKYSTSTSRFIVAIHQLDAPDAPRRQLRRLLVSERDGRHVPGAGANIGLRHFWPIAHWTLPGRWPRRRLDTKRTAQIPGKHQVSSSFSFSSSSLFNLRPLNSAREREIESRWCVPCGVCVYSCVFHHQLHWAAHWELRRRRREVGDPSFSSSSSFTPLGDQESMNHTVRRFAIQVAPFSNGPWAGLSWLGLWPSVHLPFVISNTTLCVYCVLSRWPLLPLPLL